MNSIIPSVVILVGRVSINSLYKTKWGQYWHVSHAILAVSNAKIQHHAKNVHQGLVTIQLQINVSHVVKNV